MRFVLTAALTAAALAVAAASSIAAAADDKVLLVYDAGKFAHGDFGHLAHSIKDEITGSEANVHLHATSEKVELSRHDVIKFRHVILLSSELPTGWTQKSLVNFVEKGGNLVWAFDESISLESRRLATQFGVVLSAPHGATVHDHFSHTDSSTKTDSTLVTSSNLFGSSHAKQTFVPVPEREELYGQEGNVLSNSIKASPAALPLAYRGTAFSMDVANPLAFPVLAAEDTAALCIPSNGQCVQYGSDLVLVSSLQSRTNSRVTITGSIAMFTDALMKKSQFINKLLKWTFHQSHVANVESFTHLLESDASSPSAHPPTLYRIGDMLSVSVCLTEKVVSIDREKGTKKTEWRPFLPTDAQVELKMMNPTIRTALHVDHPSGCLKTTIKLPDHHGVYSLRFLFQRAGLALLAPSTSPFSSTLDHQWHPFEVRIPVRPFKQEEEERLIVAALPYYAGWISMMASAFLVLTPFLLGILLDENLRSPAASSKPVKNEKH